MASPLTNIALLGPEIFLSVLGLILLVLEAFYPKQNRIWIYYTIGGLILTVLYLVPFFTHKALPWLGGLGITPAVEKGLWIQYPPVLNMISVDSLAVFFKLIVIAAVIMVLWLSLDYYEFQTVPMGIYCALLLFATVGMMLLVRSIDFLMAIIALELLSVTSFVLTGFIFNRRTSSEGAFKFFLVGTFSTALILFGVSYYYGYFGSTQFAPLLATSLEMGGPDFILSWILVFIIAGIGFKLAMVPFHMWAPDAYEGAPTPITAFLSVAPKSAGIALLLRLFGNHAGLNLTPILAVLAAVTMTVGNIGALHQTNVKRMLAYSSIAQFGYILVALVAGGQWGGEAALIYTLVYLFMNLGVFAVLSIVANKSQNEEICVFAGLSKRSLGLSLALVVFLLSLTGIPPLAGFIGKFSIFAAVIKTPGLLWLGILAVINSVISLFYYFRIVQQAFFKEPNDQLKPLHLSPGFLTCLLVALSVTLLSGLFPNHLLGWVRNVVGS